MREAKGRRDEMREGGNEAQRDSKICCTRCLEFRI